MANLLITILLLPFILTLSKANHHERHKKWPSTVDDEVQLVLYKRSPSGEDYPLYFSSKNPDALLEAIHPIGLLSIYIHGNLKEASWPLTELPVLAEAYGTQGIDNFVVFEWAKIAVGGYKENVQKVPQLAEILANVLNRLVSLGLDINRIHIIGYSMGAHVAGYTQTYLDFQLPRITALDPTLFPNQKIIINKSSAKLVDVIHTDSGEFGMSENLGHVDYYANKNGSFPQPGCNSTGGYNPENLCSHLRSWDYFAESVKNPSGFPAVKCPSYTEFEEGTCNRGNSLISYVGHLPPLTAIENGGLFYFNTNSKSPFAKGFDGIPRYLEKNE